MDVVIQVKQVMDNWYCGQMLVYFEIGGCGFGYVFIGRGDYGGVLYGSYQYVISVGGVDEYVVVLCYGNCFNGLQVGILVFIECWKEVVVVDLVGFVRDQYDFI